jgi:nitrite reductase/ring-hydroxylating ferredoxin subunit
MKRVPLVAVTDFPAGSAGEYVVEGKIVALFHTEAGYFAVDGMCLHAGGPIAKGAVAGCLVTCPWHGWQYDLRTGEHALNPRLKLPQYVVAVADGMVCVEWPETAA